MILKSLAFDFFYPVYGDHAMTLCDFHIQPIGIELSYNFSCVYMENAECTFMLTLSDMVTY